MSSRISCILGTATFLTLAGQAAGAQLNNLPDPNLVNATFYVTARDTGERIHTRNSLPFQSDSHIRSQIVVSVDPDAQYQTITGFGVTFTDAAAAAFSALPEKQQNQVLSAYYSLDEGCGYTLGLVIVGSSPASPTVGSYDDEQADTPLSHFSISNDLAYRIPFIKSSIDAAQGRLQLYAEPWSPPAWMKTNNDMTHGGKLAPSQVGVYSTYLAKFAVEYKDQGIQFQSIVVQHDPTRKSDDESCLYSKSEERTFAQTYLKTALAAAHMDNVRVNTSADPDLPVPLYGPPFPGTDHLEDWSIPEFYATTGIRALNNGCPGWFIDSPILSVDGSQGPNRKPASAPVVVDLKTGHVQYLPSYFYLGQFATFIRPGARRVTCDCSSESLLATAFLNPDKSLAVELLNPTDQPLLFTLTVGNKSVSAQSPAHCMETVVSGL